MKILITGASGLLGRAVTEEFSENSAYQVLGLAYRRAKNPLVRVDLTQSENVQNLLIREKPEVIIHTAAERRPDNCEKDPGGTLELNVEATRCLARAAQQVGCWLIYISTDYVFDGSNPPYSPESQTNPLNLYASSKLEGELAVKEELQSFCILRVPVLYGRVEYVEESPVTSIAHALEQDGSKKYDNWAIRYPTFVDDLAVVLRQLVEYRQGNPSFGGVFHWSAAERLTKYKMAQVIAKELGVSQDKIAPDDTPPSLAPRPKNSQLDCSALEALGIGQRTPFAEGIGMVLRLVR